MPTIENPGPGHSQPARAGRKPSHRLTSVFGASVLVIASFALTFSALEVSARLLEGVSVFSFPNYIAEELDLIRNTGGWIVHDPLLGWNFKDNFKRQSKLTVLTVGEYGLRMNTNHFRDPPQHAVLVVGDLFTAGSGVSDDDTWPAQLERSLAVPVLNGGVGGYSVAQMLLRAESLTPVLHPSAIIFGILSQDIPRDSYDLFGGGFKPWFRNIDGHAVLEGVPVPRYASRPAHLDGLHAILGHSYLVHLIMLRLGLQQWWLANHLQFHHVQSNEDAVSATCSLMDRVVKLGAESGARVGIVFFWGAGEVMSTPPAWFVTRVSACALQRGIAVLDLYDPLRKIGLEDPARFKTLWLDEGGVLGHPSRMGNAIAAKLIQYRFFQTPVARDQDR